MIPSQVRTKAGLPATHSVTWGETDNTEPEDEVKRGKDGEKEKEGQKLVDQGGGSQRGEGG